MYLVMADSREKIIGVSDTETGARHAGWDLRHDLLMGAYWEDFDMEIIEVKRV